jgi:rare lipoprotein A
MMKSISGLLSVLLLSAGFAAASDPGTKVETPAAQSSSRSRSNSKTASKASAKAGKTQVGNASWYGKAFHGRPTASGEDYDMFQLTAAHRSLPLGTYVKVTNLRNGKWAVLKVNDRGPFVGNRILDVSYGAAQVLNFRGRGIEKVKVEVVEPQTLAVATDSFTTVD